MDIKSVILSGIHRKSKTAEDIIRSYKDIKSLSRKELKRRVKKIQKHKLTYASAPEGGEG